MAKHAARNRIAPWVGTASHSPSVMSSMTSSWFITMSAYEAKSKELKSPQKPTCIASRRRVAASSRRDDAARPPRCHHDAATAMTPR